MASSLITNVKQNIDLKKIETLKKNIKLDFILEMLDKAILNTNNYKIDRPQLFVPRLLLARFQLLWKISFTKSFKFIF